MKGTRAGNQSAAGLVGRWNQQASVPLATVLRQLSPQNTNIPLSAASVQQAKAEAITQSGLLPEQVNQLAGVHQR